MQTVADFMVAGMQLKSLDSTPIELPAGTRDIMYGHQIVRGYPLWDIAPKSAGEYLDTLRGCTDGYLSESTARAFKGCWNMGSWLIFEDGTGHHPLVSRNSASKSDRPCWSDLVRDIWPKYTGHKVLTILTTNYKKRLWPMVQIGILGENTNVFLHDDFRGVSGNFVINWEKMLKHLDLIENIYSSGISIQIILVSILRDLKRCREIGLENAIAAERQLSVIRDSNEFVMASMIAQKKG